MPTLSSDGGSPVCYSPGPGVLEPVLLEACASVAAALRLFGDQRKGKQGGCRAVRSLASAGPACRQRLHALGLGGTVLAAMRAFPDDLPLQRAGCGALAQLLRYGGSQEPLFKAGAAEVLLEAMERKVADEELQAAACHALSLLAHGSLEVRQSLVAELKACELVLAAMAAFPEDAGVQLNVCRAVAALSQDNPKGREKLLGMDVCDDIAKANLAFTEHPEVLCGVFEAVGMLCSGRRCESQRLLITAGVGKGVMAAMATFAEDPEVQSKGCMAMTGLTMDFADGQFHFLSGGSCDLVLAALEGFPEDAEVRRSAWLAASCLAAESAEGQKHFLEAGAVEKVLSALRAFPECPPTQGSGCWFVKSMALGCPEGKGRLLDGGVCQDICAALVACLGDGAAESAVCSAISALCYGGPDGLRQLVDTGVCGPVVAAVRAHRESRAGQAADIAARVQRAGCNAIWDLADDAPSGRGQLVEAGACEAVASAMLAFPGDGEVQQWACGAAACLMAEGAPRGLATSARQRLAAAGACEALPRALRAFPELEVLQPAGCRATYCLGSPELGAEDNTKELAQARRSLVDAGACEAGRQMLRFVWP